MTCLMKNMTNEEMEEKIEYEGLEYFLENYVDPEEIVDPQFKAVVIQWNTAYDRIKAFLDDAEISY